MKRLFSLALSFVCLLPLMAAAPVLASGTASAPAAAFSADFVATPMYIGTAEGSIEITVENEESVPDAYVLAWGDKNGPLADYAFFPEIPATGVTTVHLMPESIIVPNTADRILVYPVEDGKRADLCATAYLPVEFFTYDYGAPLFEFCVASDVHINEENFENYNDHFKALLADLKATMPKADALYLNGDIADWGKEVEYQMFRQFIDEADLDFPVYANYGNHDSRDPNTPDLFKQYANTFAMETMWYTRETEDANYIFFVSAANERLHEYLYLTEENLTWLEQTLARLVPNEKKTFLFFHQPLANTVSDSFIPPDAGIYETSFVRKVRAGAEVSADEDLCSILFQYPDIVVFTSHTHYTLEDEHAMHRRESLPYILNTASTAYLSRGDGVHYNEAQALYVQVYEDKVLVRGRDVLSGKWLPTAQFALDYGMPLAGPMGPVPTPPAENDPPANDPPVNNPPAPSGGCFGGVSATLPVCLSSLGVALILKKRKHR